MLPKVLLGSVELVDASHDYPDRFAQVDPNDKWLVIVHHTATHQSMSVAQLYEAHKDYGGIGYNAIIYPNGSAYLVGAWNTSRAGAGQSRWLNRAAYHLAFVENLSIDFPTKAALSTCSALIANLQYALGRGLVVAPHCAFNVDGSADGSRWNTECCGTSLHQWWDRCLP